MNLLKPEFKKRNRKNKVRDGFTNRVIVSKTAVRKMIRKLEVILGDTARKAVVKNKISSVF